MIFFSENAFGTHGFLLREIPAGTDLQSVRYPTSTDLQICVILLAQICNPRVIQ